MSAAWRPEPALLEQALQEMAPAVVIADAATRRTLFANRAAIAAASGAVALEAALEGPIQRAATAGQRTECDVVTVRCADGEPGTAVVSAAPLRDQEAGISGVVATLHELGREVQSAREMEMRRGLEDFLAAASHDLKNPLTIIKGTAQMLTRATANGRLDRAKLEDALEAIVGCTSSMTSQVDELLDIASGTALRLHRGPMDLVAVTRRVVERYQATRDGKTITFEPGVPSLVGRWDPPRLERAIDNLLSNAVKYTHPGGMVRVSVAMEQAPSGEREAVLSVEDDGVGVAEEDLARIFERFRRGRNVADFAPGTGIGLATTKQIVELHGGRIGVVSSPGQGSRFTVWLPLPKDNADTV